MTMTSAVSLIRGLLVAVAMAAVAMAAAAPVALEGQYPPAVAGCADVSALGDLGWLRGLAGSRPRR